MTIFRSRAIFVVLLIIAVATASSGPAQSDPWEYRDFSQAPYHSAEAVLTARDGRALLTINCSHAGEPTLSIQFRPSADVGLSMGPVVLDWDPPQAIRLAPKLIWEPHDRGAFARDGTDDRDVSDVAAAIEAKPGTLKAVTSDIAGDPSEAFFDSGDDREAIGRVIAACPWNPGQKK
jgi:hypothetical protein